MNWTGKHVGLALGGGGVRGFSHIGVLKVLEQADLIPDLIVGSSAGALVGGAYAAGISPRELSGRVDAYLQSPEFQASALKSVGLTLAPYDRNLFEKITNYVKNRYYMARSFFKPVLIPIEDFESLIANFIPDIDIRQTRISFTAVATDLLTGKMVPMSEGSLRQAVLASCAVPGAVAPVPVGEWMLADGGIASNVPVSTCRARGADVVIAVEVSRSIDASGSLATAQDILSRAGEIVADRVEEMELRDADVVIRPDVGDLHWMDFQRAKGLIREGEIAAEAALQEIQNALPLYKKVLRFWGSAPFPGKTK